MADQDIDQLTRKLQSLHAQLQTLQSALAAKQSTIDDSKAPTPYQAPPQLQDLERAQANEQAALDHLRRELSAIDGAGKTERSEGSGPEDGYEAAVGKCWELEERGQAEIRALQEKIAKRTRVNGLLRAEAKNDGKRSRPVELTDLKKKILEKDQEISKTKNLIEIDSRELQYLESVLTRLQEHDPSTQKSTLNFLQDQLQRLSKAMARYQDISEKKSDLEQDIGRLTEKIEIRRVEGRALADRGSTVEGLIVAARREALEIAGEVQRVEDELRKRGKKEEKEEKREEKDDKKKKKKKK